MALVSVCERIVFDACKITEEALDGFPVDVAGVV